MNYEFGIALALAGLIPTTKMAFAATSYKLAPAAHIFISYQIASI
jgi:hypothetical protein